MKALLITILFPIIIFGQTGLIKGKVVCKDSIFIMKGASIVLKGEKTFYTTSDNNGNYELKNIPLGKYIIKCEYIGYHTKKDTVEIKRENISITKDFNLEMKPVKNDALRLLNG